MSKLHKIKLLSCYYHDVESGLKTAEIRFNDRDYLTGDIIELNEWTGEEFTGKSLTRRAVGVYPLDSIGLKGWVLICMERIKN